MHLQRPTLPDEAHLEFFTPFQKGTKTERFRTIANALVDSVSAKNGLLPVPGMNLNLLVELLTSMGVGWFDAMGYDNKTQYPNEIATQLINKAWSFLTYMNYKTELNTLIKTNKITAPIAAQLMLLDWPYVDWFGTDWDWMAKFGSKFSFSDWDKIQEELKALGIVSQKTLTQPDFANVVVHSPITSNPKTTPIKALDKTWFDIPFDIAWGRIPFGQLRPWMFKNYSPSGKVFSKTIPTTVEEFIANIRRYILQTDEEASAGGGKSTPFPGSTNPVGTLDLDGLGGLLGGGTPTLHYPGNMNIGGGAVGGGAGDGSTGGGAGDGSTGGGAGDGSTGGGAGDGSSTDQTDTTFVDGCTAQGKFTFPGVDHCLTMQELQDIWQKQADCARTPGSTFDATTLTCKPPEAQVKLCSDGLPEDPTTGCQRTEPKTEDKAEEKKSSTGMILAGIGILALLGGGAWWLTKEHSTTPAQTPALPPPTPSYASNPLHHKSKKRSKKSKHH